MGLGFLPQTKMPLSLYRYDYSGYGQSSGKVCQDFQKLSNCVLHLTPMTWGIVSDAKIFSMSQPSEQNTYADIEAASKCLEESYGTRQEDIILYGQSVGSGPTLDLAARLPHLRAVVLHSPILSGLRVMYPVKRTYWFDIYKVIGSFH